MLRLLRIQNLALIRGVEIEFEKGLNLLTGETGSGKSILVDALGLLLGARSSQDIIRSDCSTATLEGIFEISPHGRAMCFLSEAGLESEDNIVLIRREISASGRNRIFINNRLSTLSLLKALGEKLADIHGQQDQKSLLDVSTHREWLDFYGNHTSLVEEVRNKYRKLRATAQELASLQSNEQERLRRIDVLQYQINEICEVNPGLDEREELESERIVLANREKILALATEAYGILYEENLSALQQLNRLEKIFEELRRFDREWENQREIVQDVKFKLQELSYMVRDYITKSDFSPERLDSVQQRLYALERLTKKYGSSCRDILHYLEGCQKELEKLLMHGDRSELLNRQFETELNDYRRVAEILSSKRRQCAERFEEQIQEEFKALAMDRMVLHVQLDPLDGKREQDGIPGGFGPFGMDRVEFLLSANLGEEMKPLTRVASGGELSRLMLAIRSLCRSEETDKTFVFDEVDTGIGGRVADAVGKRLRGISKYHQVLCVTHLPQIAAFAHCHFSVWKKEIDGRTETVVKRLDESERIQEISRMLGGARVTQTARDHARQMLEYANASTTYTS